MKQLTQFLVKAKINTYASSGEGGERIFAGGAKELEFKENEFKYRDRYFGSNPFIGEEVVWQNGKAIWGMNYYGKIISEIVSVKQIYQFLQEALRNVGEDKPFRGPDSFKGDDFEYINKAEGTVEKFKGEETIFYKEEAVYRLNYHGGAVVMK